MAEFFLISSKIIDTAILHTAKLDHTTIVMSSIALFNTNFDDEKQIFKEAAIAPVPSRVARSRIYW